MKLSVIVGNRPQFIKAAALFRAADESVHIDLVHTGQHFDTRLSQLFFDELNLPKPSAFLGVGGMSHGKMTGMMLEKIESILLNNPPDWVMVFGDTNTTLAGALAASKLNIPVAHVEAGLRSFNRAMPEEINRILTDHCADRLFAPNEHSSNQLEKEGIPKERIAIVGDIMFDTFLHYQQHALKKSSIVKSLELSPKGYALATVHRQENTDCSKSLSEIIEGLIHISESLPVIFPLHPRTKKQMINANLFEKADRYLTLIEPVGYFDMIMLESNAKLILTDSGGVQKEAYFAKVPCIILRNETEWAELISDGHHQLVGANKDSIFAAYQQLDSFQKNDYPDLYGEGTAAQRIFLNLLCNWIP